MYVCMHGIYDNIYIYIYIRLNAAYGRPVMHIAPHTGNGCFEESGAGLLKVFRYNKCFLCNDYPC